MYTHPKKRRLLKREEFRRLFHCRQKYHGRTFSAEYLLRKDLTHPRLGITITRQYGKSNLRNLFKRRIKEIFRHHSGPINFGVDINIRAKNKVEGASFQTILDDFNQFIKALTNP